MLNIDFNNIKNIEQKLSQSEILALNKIFSDPKIQQKLLEIEENRKAKIKYKSLFFIFNLTFALIFSYFSSNWNFYDWFNIFLGISTFLCFLYFIVDYFINNKFLIKDLPDFQKQITLKIQSLIYSDFQHSEYDDFAFDWELEFLKNQKFINDYRKNFKIEDSIQFSFKNFLVNWFEFNSSIRYSKHHSITNNCYLMKLENPKIFFPNLVFVKNNVIDYKPLLIICLIILFFIIFVVYSFAKLFLTGEKIFIWDYFSIFGIFSVISYFWIHSFKKSQEKTIQKGKKFQIFCEDENIANVFANSVLVKKIGEISDKNKIYYDFLFFENKIFIKRNISWNFLDINFNFNVTKNLETYLDFYLDMKEIFEIIAIFAEENKK